MIRVQCSHCEKVLKIPDELAGQSRKCPNCQHPVLIPAAADELPTLQPLEAAAEPPIVLDDRQLAQQLRQQAPHLPAGAAAYDTGRHLVENASQQGAALYQRASRAVLGAVDQTKKWVQVRQLQRELRDLETARNRKLFEAGTAALEQGAAGLSIDAEKRQVQAALQQIADCQNKLNALGGPSAKSSIARDIHRQLAGHSLVRDEAVTAIGQKAHAAGLLDERLGGEIATLDSMLQTHRERLAAIAPAAADAGSQSAEARSGRRPAVVAAAAVVLLGAAWIGYKGVLFATQSLLSGTQVVASLDDEDDLAQSVGLVVCGEKVVLPDGQSTEFPVGTGTAFAISPEGHLLTNKHVVETTWNLMNAKQTLEFWRKEKLTERTPSVWVFFGGTKFPAEILHVSDKYDVAVLKIDRERGPYFRTSALDEIARGTTVHALGYPGASRIAISEREQAESLAQRGSRPKSIELSFKDSDYDYVLTTGAVSRIRKDDTTEQTWIQHNADINPGNSGGPLVTADGLVVGINTLGHKTASGIFYSLTLPQLREELEGHVPSIDWE